MKLPNWFRIGWWIVLLICVSAFIWMRRSHLILGALQTQDLILGLVWVVLMLVPIFAEISVGSLVLKQHIDNAKQEITNEIRTVRNELQQSVSIHNHLPASFIPSDSELKVLGEKVDAAVPFDFAPADGSELDARTLAEDGGSDEVQQERLVSEFATIRRKLEKEVRRLAARYLEFGVNPSSFFRLLHELRAAGIVEDEIVQPIQVVYSVCSKLLHGESLTDSQVGFVRDHGSLLIRELRKVR